MKTSIYIPPNRQPKKALCYAAGLNPSVPISDYYAISGHHATQTSFLLHQKRKLFSKGLYKYLK